MAISNGTQIQGAAEKPDGFQNEIIQQRLTLLCNSHYH
jgi:hypothetical protein